MEAVITKDDRIAMAEVDYIIKHMNERYIKKIPQKVLDFIAMLKNKKVKVYVDPHIPLENQGLKEFTLYFLMILNLKYWCNDERRKEILTMMENNQKAIDERVYDIFEQAESVNSSSSQEGGEEAASSRPKQIVTVGNSPIQTEENANENTNEVEVRTESVEENKEASKEIAEIKKENFFVKLMNKIKSMIKTKKV